MCGIAGSVNLAFDHKKIASALYHRGPDEQASCQYKNVALLHLRLSILDIAGGRQPMHLADKYSIIFNGEIYNHQEVRSRFNLPGHTSSDTETLLLLYDRFGTDFLDHLDGMFAFVILDKTKDRLFIARDRTGKKPFYYFHDGKKMAFASELNAIREMAQPEIATSNFYTYLRMGSFYRQATPYQNVHELTGGGFLTVDINSLHITETTWWNIEEQYLRQSGDTLSESIAHTDQLLHKAVQRRIESSDLEVGCFLSGGIDSGIITGIASHYKKDLKTFTVSFEGEYDEAPLAKLVAEKYHTHHTVIKISFDHLKNDVENILTRFGEPFFDSSAIPSYYVSREAKKYVTVVLNGDGADELFGGYRRYVPFTHYDFFKKNGFTKKGASLIKKALPVSHDKKSLYNYLYRLASLASHTDLDIYLSAGVDIFEDYVQYINDPGFDYMKEVKNDFDKIARSSLSGLKKIMILDFNTNLFNDLLVKMDIATMANSQEGRSAFLSKELLAYIPSLPDSYKIKGRTTKALLRELGKKYLPPLLISQPKRGFEIPLKKWVDNELKEILFDYLSDTNNFYQNLVQKSFVNDLLHKKITIGEEKRAKILWTLLAAEIWYKKVYMK